MNNFAQKRAAYDFIDSFAKPVLNGLFDAIGRTLDKTELAHCYDQVRILNKDIERLEREMINLKWFNWIRRIEIRDALAYRIKTRISYYQRIAELEERLGGK